MSVPSFTIICAGLGIMETVCASMPGAETDRSRHSAALNRFFMMNRFRSKVGAFFIMSAALGIVRTSSALRSLARHLQNARRVRRRVRLMSSTISEVEEEQIE